VENLLRQAGVTIRVRTTIDQLVGESGRVSGAVLENGERLKCDLVIFAIGVRPNVGMIPADSAIQINRGIVVNPCMRTGAPDVYAAGDCVEAQDMILNTNRTIAIWPHAYRQGFVAGCNMAGEYREYEGGFSMNSIEVCRVPTISVGLTNPEDEPERYEVLKKYNRGSRVYKKLVLRDDRLVGAILIGDIDRAGIYTGLVRDWVDVRPFKDHLLSGNFGLISLPKAYRKHLVVGDGIEV
jgi:NAD(P)H-nitrite reductase large subunit